jgi:hypothetical protein
MLDYFGYLNYLHYNLDFCLKIVLHNGNFFFIERVKNTIAGCPHNNPHVVISRT